jgi:hypothetical protein
MSDAASGPVPCARHPATTTPLRCGHCATPICPRCLVMTPVGARCPACGGPARGALPAGALAEYLRAALAGLAVATLGGLLAPLLPFFELLAVLFAGWAAGEMVSRAARRRPLPHLGVLAAGVTLLGLALGLCLLALGRLPPALPLDLRLQLALAQAAARLFGLFGLFVLLAAVVAHSRLR